MNSTIGGFKISASNISLVTSMCLMCVCTIFGNILVIVTVLRSKKLRNIPSIFLLNLCFCDLCLGALIMPLTIQGVIEQQWIHSQTSCKVVGILSNILTAGSISTVAAIAFDRYFAIIHCFRYSNWSNWRYPTIVLLIIWIFAILNGLPPLVVHQIRVEFIRSRYTCLVPWERYLGYAILMFFLTFAVPLFIMMFCYLRIIRVARLHARRIGDINNQLKHNEQNQQVSTNGIVALAFMDPIRRLSMLGFPDDTLFRRNNNGIELELYSNQSSHSNESDNTRTSSRFQREAKAIIRLVSLILVFLICWAPFVYANMAMSIDFFRNGSVSISEDLQTVSFWLMCLHCTINPLIYAIVSRRFRMALKRMVKTNNTTFQQNGDDNKTLNQNRSTRCVSAPTPYDTDSLQSAEPEIFTVEQFLTESSERYQNVKNNFRRPKKRLGRSRSSSDAFRFGPGRYLEVPGYVPYNSENYIQTTSFCKRSDNVISESLPVTSARTESLQSVRSTDPSDDSGFSYSESKYNPVIIKYDLVH